jgi:hypothetical protein
MGFELVNELKAHMPPALTPTQRLVLFLVADHARTESRRWYVATESRPKPFDELQRLTGLSASGLSKVLRELARHTAPSGEPLELRVEKGRDSRGRPVYASEGHSMTFRLPAVAPALIPASAVTGGRPLDDQSHDSTAATSPPVVASRSLGARTPGRPPEPEWSPSRATQSVSPSDNRQPRASEQTAHDAAVAALLDRHGRVLTRPEASAAVLHLTAMRPDIKSLSSYVRALPLPDVLRHANGQAPTTPRPKVDGPRCPGGQRWATDDTCGCPPGSHGPRAEAETEGVAS